MSLLPVERYPVLILASVGVWLLFFIPSLATLWFYLRWPAKLCASDDALAAIDDQQLHLAIRRLSQAPRLSATLFVVFFLTYSAGVCAAWFWLDTGLVAASTLLVGTIAGSIAVPFMNAGLTRLFIGVGLEQLSVAALSRGLKPRPDRTGLRTRLILAFLFFSVGYTVWLGGLALFSNYSTMVRTLGMDLRHRHLAWCASAERGAASFAWWRERVGGNNKHHGTNFAYPEWHWFLESVDAKAVDLSGDAPAEILSAVDLIRARMESEVEGSFYETRNETLYVWSRVPLQIDEEGVRSSQYLVSLVPVSFELVGAAALMGWLAVFILAGMIVASTIAFTNASVVLEGIKSVYAMVRNLGEGNLSISRGAQSLDESGILALDLNRFLEHLSDTIESIRESVDAVASELQSLESTAHELSTGAQSQAAAVEQASASMEEVSSASREIADMVADQAKRMNETTRAVENELGSAIEHVAERAHVVNESAAQSLDQARHVREVNLQSIEGMRQIQTSSNDILSIVDVIVSISDKTNLLALNASIEAARAGEAGRGFAVVADEVSRLADQSNQAISRIKQMIDINNERVNDGTAKVDSLGEAVEQLTKAAQLARDIGEEIETTTESQRVTGRNMMESIREMDRTASQIARATGEQTNTTGEMTNTLEQINDVAQRTAGNSDQIASIVRQLREQSDHLRAITRTFTLRNEPNKMEQG